MNYPFNYILLTIRLWLRWWFGLQWLQLYSDFCNLNISRQCTISTNFFFSCYTTGLLKAWFWLVDKFFTVGSYLSVSAQLWSRLWSFGHMTVFTSPNYFIYLKGHSKTLTNQMHIKAAQTSLALSLSLTAYQWLKPLLIVLFLSWQWMGQIRK